MMVFVPKPLPPDAAHFCTELAAPPLLIRHLVLVHAAAVELLDGLTANFPQLDIDRDAVCFGAAVHDLGKIQHPEELTSPGNRHEKDGPGLLIQHGVSPKRARFARTHGRWRDTDGLEDLIVALADNIWCGRRVGELETRIVGVLAKNLGLEEWRVWDRLDSICDEIASRGEDRLVWQRSDT